MAHLVAGPLPPIIRWNRDPKTDGWWSRQQVRNTQGVGSLHFLILFDNAGEVGPGGAAGGGRGGEATGRDGTGEAL